MAMLQGQIMLAMTAEVYSIFNQDCPLYVIEMENCFRCNDVGQGYRPDDFL